MHQEEDESIYDRLPLLSRRKIDVFRSATERCPVDLVEAGV